LHAWCAAKESHKLATLPRFTTAFSGGRGGGCRGAGEGGEKICGFILDFAIPRADMSLKGL